MIADQEWWKIYSENEMLPLLWYLEAALGSKGYSDRL